MGSARPRVALALVVAVALLAGLGAVAPASDSPVGTVAADNHTDDRPVNVSAERTGSNTIVVSVSDHAFNADPGNTSVNVSLDDYDQSVSLEGQRNSSGDYEFQTSVTELVGNEVVTDARPLVTVSYPGGNASDQVDVRLLRLGSSDPSRHAGIFRLPVETSIGHADGNDVPMQVSEAGDAVGFDATFECGESCDNGTLALDPGDFQNTVSPLRQQQFETYPGTGYLATTAEFDLSTASSPSFGVSEGTLVIRHPLIFADESYVINVTTNDPTGQYVVERTANESGGLGELDASEVVTRAGTIKVTVTHNGQTVFENGQPRLASNAPEVQYDPANGSFDFSSTSVSLPKQVETVWLNNSGNIQRFDDPTVEGQQLVLPLEDATPRFELLVVGNGTTVQATVPENDSGETNESDGQSNDSGDGDRLGTVLSGLLHSFGMGVVAFGAILVFGVVGRELRSALGVAAHALGLVVVLAGLFVLWQFHGESYGIHVFTATEFAGLGLLAGTLQTFETDTDIALILDFGMPMVVFFVALAVVLLQPVPDAVLAYVAATGGTFGAWGGFVFGMRTITPKHTISIRLVDNRTKDQIRSDEYVTANYQSGRGSTKIKVTDGTAKTSLKEGHWRFSSGTDAIEGTKDKRIISDTIVELAVSRAGAEFTVESMADDSRLSDATVTLAPGETAEDGDILQPIGDGIHRGDLPAGVSTATVRVTCDRYQSEERTYENVENPLQDTIRLAPKQGTLKVSVTLESDPVDNIPVVVSARSDMATEETQRERTNARGQVVQSGVVVGDYDVIVELPEEAEAFEMTEIDNPVTIKESETTTVNVDIRFTYELPPDVRRRLDGLRDRLDSIASHPRSDVAIPTFYTSVVDELLDTVENVPRNPELFLENGYAPAATVDALLAAAEAGVEAIDEAMSSKQNTDLFAACGDMDPVDAAWDGSFDLAEFFERASQESGQRRADIAQRLDEVDDTISQELRDLSEVRPAQDMWEQTRDMARDTSRGDLEMTAITVLTLGFLDAIEALFDRQPLRERMTRTVF